MRVIDRLYQYIQFKSISAYAFERTCEIANGYLKKQFNGGGTIGSEIIEKITGKFSDLSLVWLITGEGRMLIPANPPSSAENLQLREDQNNYPSHDQIIRLLKEKIALLEVSLADKEKIIVMLENQLESMLRKASADVGNSSINEGGK
ncbi:MAG: hypothetical protein ABI687_09060 [Flavitalea sp.]